MQPLNARADARRAAQRPWAQFAGIARTLGTAAENACRGAAVAAGADRSQVLVAVQFNGRETNSVWARHAARKGGCYLNLYRSHSVHSVHPWSRHQHPAKLHPDHEVPMVLTTGRLYTHW